MFSRLKQKIEFSTSGNETIQSKSTLSPLITAVDNANSNTKLENKKSIDDPVIHKSYNSSSHYQSSSDETSDKSESLHSRHSPPHLETDDNKPLETTLPTYHNLISKLDAFKQENNQDCADGHENNRINSENFRKLNDSLLSHIEILNNEIMEKMNENDTIRSELSRINTKYEILEYESENLKELCNKLDAELRDIKSEKEDLIIKNADLSQKYELLKLVNNKPANILHNHNSNYAKISAQTSNSSNEHKHSHDPAKFNQEESTYQFNTKCSQESLQKQLDENKVLREDLNEKNKMIKNLQQRLNDMKKTLQKELKYQSLPNESKAMTVLESTTSTTTNSNSVNTSSIIQLINPSKTEEHTALNLTLLPNTPASPPSSHNNHSFPIRRTSLTIGKSKPPTNNAQLNHLHDDTNFKYLKHVILKFLTSREYEAIHLVKAISVLLNFTNEEEKILKETLEWKMSWFGSRPRIQ